MKQKKSGIGKQVLRWVELLLHGVVLVLFAVALTSEYTSPLRTQVPAFLNLGFPLLLLLFIIGWVVSLLLKRWLYSIPYGLLLVLGWGYITTIVPLHIGGGLQREQELRVMSYNIQEPSYSSSKDTPKVLQVIMQYNPDIVGLQEAGYYVGKKARKQLQRQLENKYPYTAAYGSKGLLLLSKYPIRLTHPIEHHSSSGNGSVAMVISLGEKGELLVVLNHMQSYMLQEKEKARYTGYIQDITPSKLPNQLLEIKRRLGPSLNRRAKAAERMQNEIAHLEAKYQPAHTIVMGDLNDTPKSYTYAKLRGNRHDAYAETGFGLSPTYNRPPFSFRIDHLFYSGGLKATGSNVPNIKGASDHNPLIVDFVFKKP